MLEVLDTTTYYIGWDVLSSLSTVQSHQCHILKPSAPFVTFKLRPMANRPHDK